MSPSCLFVDADCFRQGAEVILGIGLGQNPEEDHVARAPDPHGCPPSAYEPDGMPTLAEAARALFGGLVDDDGAGNSRSGALVTGEALAYREEMGVRMNEVCHADLHSDTSSQ
jgi:hypothetical protein